MWTIPLRSWGMRRRALIGGVVLCAVLLTGCSVSVHVGYRPAATPSVSIDAAATAEAIQLLKSGTTFVDQISFRVDADIADQITASTRTDNVHKRLDATVSADGKSTEIRMIGTAVYMKTTMLAGVGNGWMSLDPTKVPTGFALSLAPGKNDPGGSARLINAIVSAQVVGTQITGTMDLTKVGTGNGISFRLPDDIPASAYSTQFFAALDSQGRLVSFVIPGTAYSSAGSLRYSDFGAVVTVSAPQDAVPAPAALYPQLGLH